MNPTATLLLVTLAAGCGGTPFQAGADVGDAAPDVELLDAAEAEAGRDAAAHVDAGDESAPTETGADAPTWPPEASMGDGGISSDAPATCPTVGPCGTYTATSPTSYCALRPAANPWATPAACSSCATYTCACILAAIDAGDSPCPSTPTCSESQGTITVTCAGG